MPVPYLPDGTSAMCDELFDEFGRIMLDSGHASGNLATESAQIIGHATSGSFWRGLQVGEAVLNLELFHWGSFEPPRSLEVLKQQAYWPCSLSVEYPAIATGGFSARSELNRSPEVSYYEIRPRANSSELELLTYSGTAGTLLESTGTRDVQELWDVLEQATGDSTPAALYANGTYSITSWGRGAYHVVRMNGEEQRTQVAEMPDSWETQRHIEIAVSSILRFRASWQSGPDAETAPVVRYGIADQLPNGATILVPRAEFGPRDKALVEKVGRSILRRYSQYLLVPQAYEPHPPPSP